MFTSARVVLLYTVFSAGFCQYRENVALNKLCSMSAKWYARDDPNWAVNGNTEGIYLDDRADNCIHTAYGRDVWWEVDFGQTYPVRNITIWPRTRFERRMRDCEVTVDGISCYKFSSNADFTSTPIAISCTQGAVYGRRVRVSKSSTKSDALINICEFQVWVCPEGYWGNDCSQRCGQCLDEEPCDRVTGACIKGCPPGFALTPDCTQEKCSENCADVCEKVNGHCTCAPGFRPPNCTKACPSGRYGPDCSQLCNPNCATQCDNVSGHCRCAPGWLPPKCEAVCPEGSHGQDCTESCGACRGALPCHHVTGTCVACEDNFLLPKCAACASGFYSRNCSQNCSTNCKTADCDRDSGHCECQPGWSPPDCVQVVPAMTKTNKKGLPIPVVAGSVGGGVVIIAVVVVAICFIARKRRWTDQSVKDSKREAANTGTVHSNANLAGMDAL